MNHLYISGLHSEFPTNMEFKIINQNLHDKVVGFIVQRQPYNHAI
jgi:hypothetical protein